MNKVKITAVKSERKNVMKDVEVSFPFYIKREFKKFTQYYKFLDKNSLFEICVPSDLNSNDSKKYYRFDSEGYSPGSSGVSGSGIRGNHIKSVHSSYNRENCEFSNEYEFNKAFSIYNKYVNKI